MKVGCSMEKNMNFRWWGCWKEKNKEEFWQKGRDKRDFDKRVRLTGFWLRVLWPPMKGASSVEWRFGCLNEWPPMRVSSLVEWGFRCLKEESVWVFECEVSDLGVWVSVWKCESDKWDFWKCVSVILIV